MENITKDSVEQITISSSFSGVLIKVHTMSETFILETSEAKEALKGLLNGKGFTTTRKPRQEYARVTVNK